VSLAEAPETKPEVEEAPIPLPPRRRWRRRLGWTAAVLALVLGAALGFAIRYPGLSTGIVNQMRYSTFEESSNKWKYVSYLTGFLEELTYEPKGKIYNFKNTPSQGLDLYEQGRLLYHQGKFADAAARIERHIREHGESKDALFWLALSYMRDAEAENCLAALADPEHHEHALHDPASYCSLPVRRTHDKQDASRKAARTLERLLDRYGAEGSDARLYRWLLNFSYMTVGGYPAEVPARYRIETPFMDAFYGREAARRQQLHADLKFVDRARELGVDNFGTGRGAAVEDFDGDGWLDLVSSGSFGGVKLFHNDHGQRFVDVTAGSGLENIRQPMSISVADYNGDGLMDLFVVCPYTHFHLFANRGGNKFEDVTASSGLLDAIPKGWIATSWMSAWGDVNNDGQLDLFVAGWAFEIPFLKGLPGKRRIDSKLFINEGGHFRDATAEYGLADALHDRHLIGAAFGDYDGDGRVDLYVTGPMPGTTALYHNVDGKRFEKSDALDWREPGFTAAFVDVNHDGRLDIFHGGFSDARTAVTQAVFGERRGELKSGHNVIFLQRPDGRFEPHPEFFEPGMETGSMGSSYGDLNNDGCLDFYLGSGNPEPWFVLPSLMFLGRETPDGRCTGQMENVSMLDGFGTVQKGHGKVFFDFDNDGNQDVYSSLGGMWPADPWYSQLFVNQGHYGNSWVKIRLRGRKSNRSGVGSMIEVDAHRADGTPLVRTYLMDHKTCFGSAPLLAHIGLERAMAIDSVKVRWLGSGCVGTYPARLGELNVLDETDCLRPEVKR
jgi:VCBS repeat protein